MKTTLLTCCYLLIALISAQSQNTPSGKPDLVAGGIVRTDRSQKDIHLVFTGHEFGDGGEIIRAVLKKHSIKASFFLTGDFYRNPRFAAVIAGLKKDGNYLGAHSDKHVLYCTWEKRDSTLVTQQEFTSDILDNYGAMARFGIKAADARFFLPAYEWYNDTITAWTKDLGFTLVNFTPGTYSNADWTHPELGNQYLSTDTIYSRILRYEQSHSDGLNGFILLTHIGTDPRRKDKFYARLDELITTLKGKGYHFKLLNESIN